ncbi:glycosyltransferase [Ilyobacter polytropus]|uniref:Glycosyl transferase family 28 C-terminal domain-containing protein n=1 Tax=Ilyobacter polytropus (strain ATCC 51220 / DSM 2926 / LMG 16218 / CuHBu1) TaxID=572544 RepID=E3HCP9_ILYPC|nr:glycosyltransferase [Ilyobacter polytropus]ADO84444.1 hypothetical protein Ilyop_2688 [Ilyobacter polytropus DSM 2926]
MKYKVFYISSHGFGHLTRCLAHIEKILEETNYNIYIACGEKQNEFSKLYLQDYKKRLRFSDIVTDIGLINIEKSLTIDKIRLEKILKEFISSWDETIKSEVSNLGGLDIVDIYTDISPIGVLVGKTLKKKIIGSSNFTWYLQYKNLNLAEDIVEKYHEIDQIYDEFHAYPLHLDIGHMKCKKKYIDYISRKIDDTKVQDIREIHGKSIFLSCGKSASLEKIRVENFNGTIFCTSGIQVESAGANICQLPLDIRDTQNYIAASELIISKAGWGTVAEAICGETPMVLMERDGVLEDTHIINELKKQGRAISISENCLRRIDYLDLRQRLLQTKI